MAKEDLKKMTRSQLVKLAKTLGLKPLKSWSDVKLRNEIRRSRKGGAKAPVKKGTGAAIWPAEWPEEKREEYYIAIVGGGMPDDERAAYAMLLDVIDKAIPDAAPVMTDEGPDCQGIFYEALTDQKREAIEADLKKGKKIQEVGYYCNYVCPHMPLCKAICEQRPELRKLAHELTDAKDEVDKLSDSEAKELKGKAKAKGKAKKAEPKAEPKKAKVARKANVDTGVVVYVWVGKVKEYEQSGAEEEMLEVFKKMSARKSRGFTFAEAVEWFGEWYEDERKVAKDNLDLLVEQGDVVVQ